ncbi:hypothetical protein A3735_24800, partial [Oleiphilus sp. HI0061]
CDSPITVEGGGSIDIILLCLLSIFALAQSKSFKQHIRFLPRSLNSLAVGFALIHLSLSPSLSEASESPLTSLNRLYINSALGLSYTSTDLNEFDQQLQSNGLDAKAIDENSERLGWRFGLGYELNNNWALELNYLDLGEVDIKFEGAYTDSESFFNAVKKIHPESGAGWEISGSYRQTFLDRFSAFAKAGIFSWQGSYDASQFGSNQGEHKTSGSSFSYGIGAGSKITDNWQLDAQLERFELDNDSSYLASVSLKYRFDDAVKLADQTSA